MTVPSSGVAGRMAGMAAAIPISVGMYPSPPHFFGALPWSPTILTIFTWGFFAILEMRHLWFKEDLDIVIQARVWFLWIMSFGNDSFFQRNVAWLLSACWNHTPSYNNPTLELITFDKNCILSWKYKGSVVDINVYARPYWRQQTGNRVVIASSP